MSSQPYVCQEVAPGSEWVTRYPTLLPACLPVMVKDPFLVLLLGHPVPAMELVARGLKS